MARAYYNEIDRDAVHVLRCLIADGLIAPGDVDDRSIKDVRPDDLAGYTQCHFFAGAGVWSLAARMAEWPDDRPLWTGSCPCQPFSAAGKGRGTDDPRHLWPDFFRLIRARRPSVVMGEQVAGAPGYGWFDGVRTDLAGEGFASRVVDIPACSVDAPHIRQRLYWCAVADADRIGSAVGCPAIGRQERPITGIARSASIVPLADADRVGPSEIRRDASEVCGIPAAQREPADRASLSWGEHAAAFDDVVHPAGDGRREGWPEPELRSGRPAVAGTDASGVTLGDAFGSRLEGQRGYGDNSRGWEEASRPVAPPDGRNGSAWSDHEWLVCHDGKARRTEPGLRLLVDGMAGRIPAWRLGGNAIVAPLAAEVLRAYLDTDAKRIRLTELSKMSTDKGVFA